MILLSQLRHAPPIHKDTPYSKPRGSFQSTLAPCPAPRLHRSSLTKQEIETDSLASGIGYTVTRRVVVATWPYWSRTVSVMV